MSKQSRGYDYSNTHKLSYAQIRKQFLKLSLKQTRKIVLSVTNDEVGEPLDEYDLDFDQPDDGEIGVSEDYTDDQIFMDEYVYQEKKHSAHFLNFNDNFIISVLKDEFGTSTCYFEPPRWMTSRINKEYKEVLNGIIRIVQRIADTFETSHQLVLDNPQIFLEVKMDRLVQRDFVTSVNMNDNLVNEGDLSLIKDKIWFVWEKQCFPLSSIFKK